MPTSMKRISTAEVIKTEGEKVELFGWVHNRRDHGKLIFIDLRDRAGLVQVVFNNDEQANNLRLEYLIKVQGEVKKRPESMVNKDIPNGEYEISASSLEVINAAEEIPIPVDSDGYDINEEVRMKYRYLDLRRDRMRRNLEARSKVFKHIRDFLASRGFWEIETPVLSKSTPEGARDYLVPSRIKPGSFYALPQSPQQYKQLLMVAGIERYYQFPRCFRDEDTRGDRQPEFTQLDLEMSFASQEDILELTEELFTTIVKKLYPEKKMTFKKFPRLTYKEVMEKYKSDKPDLRKNKDDKDELAFAFVVDFPMFKKKEDTTLGAVHHPFTLPTFDTSLDPGELSEGSGHFNKVMEALETEEGALELSAYQYDLVLNGYEVGGGSIRTHSPKLLKKVFERLGHYPEEVEEKFGHILEAFKYGAPPHGGIAPGMDRVMMILQNEPNIREVIAFPKTGDGRDVMMGAPSEADKEQLDDLGLKLK